MVLGGTGFHALETIQPSADQRNADRSGRGRPAGTLELMRTALDQALNRDLSNRLEGLGWWISQLARR